MSTTLTASDEWYAWRDTLATWQPGDPNFLSPMVAFEQLALRSAKEKRCAECGEAGTVPQAATKYNHVPYFLCEECDTYWRGRSA